MRISPTTAYARLSRSVAARGLRGTLAAAAGKTYHGARRGWWVHLATLAFDVRHRVETRRIVQHDGSGSAQRSVHTYYQRLPPGRFRTIVKRLEIDPAGYTFVDVGCGKGGVLLLAAQAGFRKILGVELSSSLTAVAERNIASCRGIPLDGVELTVECADATEWELPPDPLVLFLFNPLPREPMRLFVDRLHASLEASPRPALLVYAYALARTQSFPVLVPELDATPFLARVADGRGWAAYHVT